MLIHAVMSETIPIKCILLRMKGYWELHSLHVCERWYVGIVFCSSVLIMFLKRMIDRIMALNPIQLTEHWHSNRYCEMSLVFPSVCQSVRHTLSVIREANIRKAESELKKKSRFTTLFLVLQIRSNQPRGAS